MKKLVGIFLGLIIICLCSCGTKPGRDDPSLPDEDGLELDISKFESWGNSTYDKATSLYTTTEPCSWIGLWVEGQGENWSDYNCVRIKYKSQDYGFFLEVEYTDNTAPDGKYTEEFYCPSNKTEFIVPLNKERLVNIRDFGLMGIWNHNVHVTLESLTLLNREDVGPSVTWTAGEKLKDTGASKKIAETLDAWTVVPDMGVGFQYSVLAGYTFGKDFGIDASYAWGYPIETKETIHAIAEKGFKTLRLQTSGSFHVIDNDFTLDPAFMKQLKKVVDWAIEEEMYVVIVEGCCSYYYPAETSDKPAQLEVFKAKNDWIENHLFGAGYCINRKYKDISAKYLKAFWNQIATAFNGSYDEHLIFEFMNEPVDIMHLHDWNPYGDCAQCKEDTKVLNELNQLCLDTIRATGGNNAQRLVMVPTLGQDFSAAGHADFKLPTDTAQNKIIVAVHDYPMGTNPGPNGNIKKYYNSTIKQNCIVLPFQLADEVCFNKHIPVAVTEVGCSRWTELTERMSCIKDFMTEVTKDGRSCAVTMMENSAVERDDYFGYMDKETNTWYEDEFVDLMIKMAAKQDISAEEDFINKNKKTPDSIVGKELLSEKYLSETQFAGLTNGTFVFDDWTKGLDFEGDIFVRSVPSEYKLQFKFNIDKTAGYSSVQIMWQDNADNWKMKPLFNKNNILSGGKYYSDANTENIELYRTSDTTTLVLEINEEMALNIESSKLHLQGFGATLTSVMVVEK